MRRLNAQSSTQSIGKALNDECSFSYCQGRPPPRTRFTEFLVLARPAHFERDVTTYAAFREETGVWKGPTIWWDLAVAVSQGPVPAGVVFYVKSPVVLEEEE